MKDKNEMIIPQEVIMSKIFIMRGQKVILDKDLAELYEVETKALKQAENETWISFLSILCLN